MTERAELLSHGDTETQRSMFLGVSASLWPFPLCDLLCLCVVADQPTRSHDD
jgi:hypothetical protein